MYGKVDIGGYAIIWDNKIDLYADKTWGKGKMSKTF